MNNSLKEQLEAFVNTRIACSQLKLEDNKDYQHSLKKIYMGANQDISDTVDDAIIIAEKSAYKQGFLDGLSIMAGLSA